VPTFGTRLELAALAPVAVPAAAVKATTANANTASRAGFVLPLSRILSPMESIEAATATVAARSGTYMRV
jgi:hypothetical protein